MRGRSSGRMRWKGSGRRERGRWSIGLYRMRRDGFRTWVRRRTKGRMGWMRNGKEGLESGEDQISGQTSNRKEGGRKVVE